MKKLIMISALLSCLLVMPEGIMAQNKTNDKEQFKYIIDEFADIKVMRYQIPAWDNLSLKQQPKFEATRISLLSFSSSKQRKRYIMGSKL